jgi:hypothetical protein
MFDAFIRTISFLALEVGTEKCWMGQLTASPKKIEK